MITETKNTWVDENNNSWSKELYTIEQALKYSESLIGCNNCSDCSFCRDCNNCSFCSDCSGYKLNKPEKQK